MQNILKTPKIYENIFLMGVGKREGNKNQSCLGNSQLNFEKVESK